MEIAPANYLFCGENDLIKIDFEKNLYRKESFKEKFFKKDFRSERGKFRNKKMQKFEDMFKQKKKILETNLI